VDFLGAKKFKSFEDAKIYSQTLGLKTSTEWFFWAESGLRPKDIPHSPYLYYGKSGWNSWSDFLGVNKIKLFKEVKETMIYKTFDEARLCVRALGIKNCNEWWSWARTDARPKNIPSNPSNFYSGCGWESWGDFLGTGRPPCRRIINRKSFEEARTYARSLELKSGDEWRQWVKTDARPKDIAVHPAATYKNHGWNGMHDFLGIDKESYRRNRKMKSNRSFKSAKIFRSFEEVRTYARALELKSSDEWREWVKTYARPKDVPANPQVTYSKTGWSGWGDFLGNSKIFRAFEDARKYAKILKFRSSYEWREWAKTDARPADIPNNPSNFYSAKGWSGWPDFLGYDYKYVKTGQFKSFEEARSYARKLGFKVSVQATPHSN
jgi:hypothetical protein